MLYEDAEKLKASSLILSLCMKPSNLSIISENGLVLKKFALRLTFRRVNGRSCTCISRGFSKKF
jgi:hypothetical protein